MLRFGDHVLGKRVRLLGAKNHIVTWKSHVDNDMHTGDLVGFFRGLLYTS